MRSIDKRLAIALSCYAILAIIAAIFLDGALCALMLCFLAILALKSIHAPRMED